MIEVINKILKKEQAKKLMWFSGYAFVSMIFINCLNPTITIETGDDMKIYHKIDHRMDNNLKIDHYTPYGVSVR